MSDLGAALLYGAVAGLAIPAGAMVARRERVRPRWLEEELRHSVIAFGAGVLLGAVALVLIPEGAALLPAPLALAAFTAGGALFAFVERVQSRRGGTHAQFLAMLSDFVPEALALGATIASNPASARLLALLIAVQNLPEAFNAWREMRAGGEIGERRLFRLFVLLAAVGPVAVLAGALVFASLPVLTGLVMMGAAGGILFLMFQDIAPDVRLENRQAPALAAVGGFGFALAGQLLVG